jgi:hypothetical protein
MHSVNPTSSNHKQPDKSSHKKSKHDHTGMLNPKHRSRNGRFSISYYPLSLNKVTGTKTDFLLLSETSFKNTLLKSPLYKSEEEIFTHRRQFRQYDYRTNKTSLLTFFREDSSRS